MEKEISQEEYTEWKEMKKYQAEDKHTPDPFQEDVQMANEISIIDYAKKNGLKVIKETGTSGVILDPVTNKEITISKTKNTWTGIDLEDKREGGRMIRFYAKVNRIYPKSHEEWIGCIGRLNGEREKYKSSEDYNKEYSESNENGTKLVSEKVEKREKANETVLANSLSIVDIAKKNNYEILSEEENIATIKDPLTDGVITVRKDTNRWTGRNADGRFTGGKTISFLARMEEMNEYSAKDYLLENRAKYLSKEEYIKIEKSGNEDHQTESDSAEKVLPEEKAIKENSSVLEQASTTGKSYFSREQLAQLLAGARRGIDIKLYNKIELNHMQMRELRLGLQKGIKLSAFALKTVPADYLREVRLAAINGYDIDIFNLRDGKPIYSATQAKEIRLAMKNGLTRDEIDIFAKSSLHPEQMKELRIGLQDGFKIMSEFNTGQYKAEDIHTIRMNLTVRHYVEAIKHRVSDIYNFIATSFSSTIAKQLPGFTKEKREQEIEQEVRDITTEMAEVIDKTIPDKTLEEKTQSIEKVLEKTVETAKTFTQINDTEQTDAINLAAKVMVDTLNKKNLMNDYYSKQKNAYVKELSEIVQQENVRFAEFTQKLINDNELTLEQKRELIDEAFGNEFGKTVAEQVIKCLPELVRENLEPFKESHMEMLENVEELELE